MQNYQKILIRKALNIKSDKNSLKLIVPQNHINGSSTGIEPAASSAASSSNWSDNLSEYSSRFAQSYNGMAVAAAASRADPASYFGSAGKYNLFNFWMYPN